MKLWNRRVIGKRLMTSILIISFGVIPPLSQISSAYATLSGSQMVTQATADITSMQNNVSVAQAKLQAARAVSDIICLSGVNELLLQEKVLLTTAQQALILLQGAVYSNDLSTATHEFTKIEIAKQKVDVLAQQVASVIGENPAGPCLTTAPQTNESPVQVPSVPSSSILLVLVSGGLSGVVPSDITFPSITLDGTAKTATTMAHFSNVIDATGSGNGWRVTATMTRLFGTENLLPAGSVTLTINSIPYPIDGVAEGVTIHTAPSGTGMGVTSIPDIPATLSLPASAFADAYSAYFTTTLATSP